MAAAAIPALIEAAPTIISGAMAAKNIISKYAPTAKKIAGMLFKSRSKSPSSLLKEIQNAKVSDIQSGMSKVGSLLQSEEAAKLAEDAGQLVDLASSAYKGVSKARKALKSRTRVNEEGDDTQPIRRKKKNPLQNQTPQIQQLLQLLSNPNFQKKIPPSFHTLLEQLK